MNNPRVMAEVRLLNIRFLACRIILVTLIKKGGLAGKIDVK